MFGIFRRLRSQRPETVLTPRSLVGRNLHFADVVAPDMIEGICPGCGGSTTTHHTVNGDIEHCNGCGCFIDRVRQVWQNYPF
jgi:hypothetical protein